MVHLWHIKQHFKAAITATVEHRVVGQMHSLKHLVFKLT